MPEKINKEYVYRRFAGITAQWAEERGMTLPSLAHRTTSLLGRAWTYIKHGKAPGDEDYIRFLLSRGLEEVKRDYLLQQSEEGAQGWFWRAIRGFFTAQYESKKEDTLANQYGLMGKAMETFQAATETDKDSTRWLDFNKWVNIGVLDEQAARELNKTLSDKSFAGMILNMLIGINFTLGMVGSVMSAGTADYQKRINKIFTPNHPTDENLLRNYFNKLTSATKVHEKLQESGYSDEDIDILINANFQTMDLVTIKTLYLRGEIDQSKAIQEAAKIGIDKELFLQLEKTWDIIPSVSDILWMVGKEAFEDDIIQQYGYDEEYPQSAEKYAKAHGLSPEWMRKYWYAHWNAPAIGQGYEMFHRGIINAEQLDGLFKIIEMPPFWRDKLTKMSYRLLTRVDLRRIRLMGVITKDELFERYKMYGYNDEDARIMTEWTELYNEPSIKDLTRSQVETALKYDQITETEALDRFKEMGYQESNAKIMIDIIKQKERDKEVKEIIKAVEVQYKNGLIDQFDVKDLLSDEGVSEVKIRTLILRWKKSRKLGGKNISKEDIRQMLSRDVIGLIEAGVMLQKDGYTKDSAALYLSLWTDEKVTPQMLSVPTDIDI